MKLIKYKILGNSVENKTSTLADFIAEFSFLFIARTVPPISVILDLCNSDPDDWGAGNRIQWEKFQPTVDDCCEAISDLKEKKELIITDIPTEIDSAYKWYIWQHEVKYQIPYHEHKALCDTENKFRKFLKKAIEEKNKAEQLKYHLKSIEAADALSDFIDPFLLKK